MASLFQSLPFLRSTEVDLDLKLFVSHLRLLSGSLPPDVAAWYVSARVLSSGVAVSSITACTGMPIVDGGNIMWQEWLTLPVKYRDLQRGDQVVRTKSGVRKSRHPAHLRCALLLAGGDSLQH